MEWISAKTLLSKNKHQDWFGHDYTMNLYRGCHHGCIYCDSRSSCYGIDHFDLVRGKENTEDMLRRELASKRTPGVIGMGSMSDPYNHDDVEHQLTRKALKLIHQYRFGVSIATKSEYVIRDIDLLAQIQTQAPVNVSLSITTANDMLSQQIERRVSPSSARFQALKELSAAGIYAGVLLMPILPFITDHASNIREIVRRAQEAGAKYIYPSFGMTLRENQREHYFRWLDKLYPGLKEQYIHTYGMRYGCMSTRRRQLEQVFQEACEKYGIIYRMPQIITAYKWDRGPMQLELF
ncbi:SPL family radical SAM protein [Paenibacillus guangzhouensis]|uniref:SPL family radical SAM protein n=1 Tax=Paenibacillus guangzhouensis TaxID=1473112 RepID=UPI001266E63A|nr:radical SAM protein [Paenibacillus guangzhouensis]